MFTVKDNQKNLKEDIKALNLEQNVVQYETIEKGHGRLEVRHIWVRSALNDYVNFPHVHQVFLIEHQVEEMKPKRCDIRLINSSDGIDKYQAAVLAEKEIIFIKNDDESYELGFKNKIEQYEQRAIEYHQQSENITAWLEIVKINQFCNKFVYWLINIAFGHCVDKE